MDPDATLAQARRFGETVINLGLIHFGLSIEGRDGKRMVFAARIDRLNRSGNLPADLESGPR